MDGDVLHGLVGRSRKVWLDDIVVKERTPQELSALLL